jgi:hypothetical protein
MPAITSLPYTITLPGVYWLDSTFSVSMATGSAITVAASFVTIEGRGNSITNSNGTANLANMVGVTGSRSGIIVDGLNSYGFFRGVSLDADRCIVRGCNIHSWFRCIVTDGKSNLVKNNHLTAGGSTASGYTNSHVFAVEMSGTGATAIDNTITNLSRVGFDPTIGEIAALSFSNDCTGGFAIGNLGSIPDPAIRSFGIWVGGTSRVACEDNTMINFNVGIGYSSPPDGELKDNTILGATTDYLWSDGDVDDGGRNT